MHDAARDWVTRNWMAADHIVDVGGRNVNYGTVRHLWPDAETYVAIDLYPGEGVDWVGDFLDFEPAEPVDLVICMEVFEHCDYWATLVKHAASILTKDRGRILVTAAAEGRIPHSGIDGGALRPGEWYENIDRMRLTSVLAEHFKVIEVETAMGEPLAQIAPSTPGDIYGKAAYPR